MLGCVKTNARGAQVKEPDFLFSHRFFPARKYKEFKKKAKTFGKNHATIILNLKQHVVLVCFSSHLCCFLLVRSFLSGFASIVQQATDQPIGVCSKVGVQQEACGISSFLKVRWAERKVNRNPKRNTKKNERSKWFQQDLSNKNNVVQSN